ncbi:unnamed protein product [Chrysoparadoxa australica]
MTGMMRMAPIAQFAQLSVTQLSCTTCLELISPFLQINNACNRGKDALVKRKEDATSAVLMLLEEKKRGGFVQFSLDGLNLDRLFWADAQAIVRALTFGQVVIMDATFGGTIYGHFKLVLMVGVDGNASAIIAHEDTDSFIWILKQYENMTHGAGALTCIFSDRDPALMAAVAKYKPHVGHFACKWHIMKNITKQCAAVPQLETLVKLFSKASYQMSERGLDTSFKQLLKFLKGYPALQGYFQDTIWKDKKMWAFCFRWTCFTLGINATQRVESMFNALKKWIDRRKKTLVELIRELKKMQVAADYETFFCGVLEDIGTPYVCDRLKVEMQRSYLHQVSNTAPL